MGREILETRYYIPLGKREPSGSIRTDRFRADVVEISFGLSQEPITVELLRVRLTVRLPLYFTELSQFSLSKTDTFWAVSVRLREVIKGVENNWRKAGTNSACSFKKCRPSRGENAASSPQGVFLNFLGPKINIQILHTGLHAFLKILLKRIC